MLRYRADIKTLLFVATYFALVAVQWAFAPRALWLAIPLLATTCAFSFLGAVATHNSVHCPVFRRRWMNRAFQIALTLTYGHPVSAYVPGHNLSHHKYTQSRRDVMRTTKVRYRWNLLNGLLFMSRVVRDILPADMRYFKAMYRRNPPWFRQMLLESAVFLGAMGVLLALDWKKFILYVLIPHQYAAWGIVTMNYLQHDGCDEDSEYNHSRNFVGRWVNWWTYNNGFHSIHHMEPGLHWSLLPAAHARRVAPFIHPNLDQPSLLAYLFRSFFWPGQRLRYDGAPVVLPKEEPDEEWIPGPKETPSDVSLGAIAPS
ncbi:fatty acid desaturase family protein [Sorangium sp. So ce1099]|uniref:fatty acid desaturase family protein n=1 Tax=Sorangium sp. So ce1099 TaxID=3133331 RepID=UPI003F615D36